jgi:hypothetical protein
MSTTRNPGRVAGLWYLLLILSGPLRLIYIPVKLFVHDDPSATVANIASHELLFRVGMVSELVGALILIFLVLAFYRLFAGIDKSLAVQVAIFGGLMPAVIYFVNVSTDAAALTIVRGAPFLSAFDKPQRDAIAMLLLDLHDDLVTASLVLAGVWLFPLAILVYRLAAPGKAEVAVLSGAGVTVPSGVEAPAPNRAEGSALSSPNGRFLPRILGVWLFLAACAWLIMGFTGFLAPQFQPREFTLFQPAFFAEIALMLWLLIKGAKP